MQKCFQPGESPSRRGPLRHCEIFASLCLKLYIDLGAGPQRIPGSRSSWIAWRPRRQTSAGLTFVFWSPSAKDAAAGCWSQVRGETEPRQRRWRCRQPGPHHLTTAPSPSLSPPLSRTVNEGPRGLNSARRRTFSFLKVLTELSQLGIH